MLEVRMVSPRASGAGVTSLQIVGIPEGASQNANQRVQPTSCVGYCMEYHGQRARLTR